jgi:hypothetical protein
MDMWYDNFKVGDTIRYDINYRYRKTGEVKDFILTEEMLGFIKRYEDESNFHNMRVVSDIDRPRNNTHIKTINKFG